MKFNIEFKDQEYPQSNRNYTADENLLSRTFNSIMAKEIINWAKLSSLNFKMTVTCDLQTWIIEKI